MKIFSKSLSIALLIFWLCFSLWAAFHDSMVIDEGAHIAAGLHYLTSGQLAFNLTHPPLIKIIAAIPLKLVGMTIPEYRFSTNEYVTDLFFNSGNNPDRLLFISRFTVVSFNLILILLSGRLLYFWRNWCLIFFAGFCTLANPTFLAHSHFVSFDVPVTLLMFLSVLLAMRAMQAESYSLWILSGICTGLAVLTKVSGWFVVPLICCLLLIDFFRMKSGKASLMYLAPLLIVPYSIMSLFSKQAVAGLYQYYTDTFIRGQLPGYASVIDTLFRYGLTRPLALMFMILGAAGIHIFTGKFALNFFSGKIYHGGDPFYFIKIFLLKEPTPFLCLLALVAFILVMRRKILFGANPQRGLLIAGLAFISCYWAVVFFAQVDLGIRYLLPIYPWMGVVAGIAISQWIGKCATEKGRAGKQLLVFFGVTSQFVALWLVFPYYLSYFNLPSGGMMNGYRWSQDSNYDWGQDLYRLVDWADEHKIDKLYLDYAGGFDPAYYFKDKLVPWNAAAERPAPGAWFAISVFKLEYIRAGWQGNNYYAWLDTMTPAGRAGSSILIYKMPYE